jgi:hypothetical protein
MRELYVYYRVRAGDEPVALAIVRAFQAELRQRFPHLATRLLRRPEVHAGQQTWMETYAIESSTGDEGVGVELQHTIETVARALAPHIDGSRHAEVFVECGQAGAAPGRI